MQNNIHTKRCFAEVILPLAIYNTYTYLVPDDMAPLLQCGHRVLVQFGKQKLYSAIVYKISNVAPTLYQAKAIHEVLDKEPIVSEKQLRLWQWMADYYLCTIGEVMAAALPAGLKLQSETKINAVAFPEEQLSELTDEEYLVWEALQTSAVLRIEEIASIVGRSNIMPLIRSLMEKTVVSIGQDVQEGYKVLNRNFVKLASRYQDKKELEQVLITLERKAPKQANILLSYIMQAKDNEWLERGSLLKKANSNLASLLSLVQKQVLEQSQREVSRITESEHEIQGLALLNTEQQAALESINNNYAKHDTVLLHGVTSSGKTEVYIHLINEQLQQNKSVLFLVPEIALTAQMIGRLQRIYGSKVLMYHSRFNEMQRVEIWNKLLNSSESYVVLGARSAVFLPFKNLGLVVVDEEHESSYKQQEPSPRYHARELAIVLAKTFGAKVLLGSATPSIESYFYAQSGKYALVQMLKRYGEIDLPLIEVVDMKEQQTKKLNKAHFSSILYQAVEKAIQQKQQSILFQNRRGYAPVLSCATCSWVPQCIHCDVSLTYYKNKNYLKCHYCSYTSPVPLACEACGDTHLSMQGFGTEKVEDDLQMIMPEARLMRMDLDTTSSKGAFNRIIDQLQDQQIDVLIGTQMITKGLDFNYVTVVGILNADAMLSYPDFRASERAFQLMAQVAGRAGRRKLQGTVIIQTRQPQHPVIQWVLENNYRALYDKELEDRKAFHYPPFYRLIKITFKHKNPHSVQIACEQFASILSPVFGTRLQGPFVPPIARIQNKFIQIFYLKSEQEASPIYIKAELRKAFVAIKSQKEYASLQVIFDVDPY